jgi:hypothetical protein
MIAGLDGHLVSSAFVEQQVAGIDVEPVRRQLTARRRLCASLGPASVPRAILQVAVTPLLDALGFDPPTQVECSDAGIAATASAAGQPVAIVVTSWAQPFDPQWRLAVTQAMKRSAAWCLMFNGAQVRIVDATRLYARRHLQFDIDLALDTRIGSAALCQTLAARALGARPTDADSLRALVEASDRHAAGVCRSLREGVLSASGDVLSALVGRARDRARLGPDSFEQALTIVYRMLFLFFAEARALVPVWHPVYRESYSLESLRDLSEHPRGAPGLWDALRAISRLAHAGCCAGDLKVTPFNGRLFSPARTPLAERRGMDDEAARRAVLALSTRAAADRAGRERIAYRDLGVEQLGAVYETLLDYEPRVDRGRVTLTCGSRLRKTTGSFYTPQPIADYLVRRTLGPLVRDATPERILQLRVVDPAMGSGAFLVAACRYLGAQYEAALVRAGGCHASDIGEPERASIRRAIAERCLYGVDLNPMAVQLARLSLWLATLAADRPLSFLDHRLQTGDSLLGAWLADLKQPPVARRRADLPLFVEDAAAEMLRHALPVRFSLESTPNDTLDQVRTKERAFAALTGRSSDLSRWKRVADTWCATWFASRRGDDLPPTAFGALSDAILGGRGALPDRLTSTYLDTAHAIADARRFFHWELEFPEVFFDRDGRRLPNAGFDAVLGNPPWEMIRADEGQSDNVANVVRFTRDSGIYTAQSDGHANRYQLFVERAVALTRTGGRIGLVLPSGLATDHGSARLRRLLFSRCAVDAIVGMDNHRGVFPIHRSVRFLLVTASAGGSTDCVQCRLDVDDPATLESMADEPTAITASFPIHVSPALLERISGEGLAIPVLRTRTDLAIVERAASLYPPLGDPRGWSARFGRELNATDDRVAFRDGGRGLPVLEGKHVEPFHAATDGARHSIRAADARRRLRSDRHERPRLGYRDVASATNRTTLIAAVLPAHCVTTHTIFCLRTPLPLRAHYFLCALFNSLVVNFLVRLRVTTHVTTAIVERLPIPTAESMPAAFREIAAIGRLLSRRSDPDAFARLNARVAELYQLSEEEFEYVLGTFPLVSAEDRRQALEIFRTTQR